MGTLILSEGVHEDIPHADYLADPVLGGSLSATGAKRLLPPSCPALYRWYADHPVTKPEYDFGHLAHGEVLGAGPEIVTVNAADWRTKAAKTARQEAHERGAVPVLAHERQIVRDMAAALRADSLIAALLADDWGRAEVTLVMRDGPTGVMRRARVDWLRSRAVGRAVAVDYKTTTDAAPSALDRQMYRFGYHLQSDWYLDLLQGLGRADRESRFCFVAQEKSPPYLATVYTPDLEALAVGRRRNRAAIERYRDCTASGVWPGYTDDVVTVSLPRYATYDDED